MATDPIFLREALERTNRPDDKARPRPTSYRLNVPKRPTYRFTSHVTTATDSSSGSKVQHSSCCILCNGTHDLDECKTYLKKALVDRKYFLTQKGLCYGCYGTGHMSRGCAQKRRCQTCSRRHPTGLHDENFCFKASSNSTDWTDNSQPNASKYSTSIANARIVVNETTCNINTMKQLTGLKAMPIVPVKVRIKDSCSSGTFAAEYIRKQLGIEGTDTKVTITTKHGPRLHDTKALTGLIVSDLDGKNCIELPKTFTRNEIPASEKEIPRPELARRWQHLKRIANEMPPALDRLKVGLLIGTDCPKAIEPKDFVASKDGGPFAISTFGGWTVQGRWKIKQVSRVFRRFHSSGHSSQEKSSVKLTKRWLTQEEVSLQTSSETSIG